MDPLRIIKKYVDPGSLTFDVLIEHGRMVMTKALAVAENVSYLSPNLTFLREAAMLHDIGIIFVNAPNIGCHGEKPYLYHGFLGRELLEAEGFPLHALVCERHVGIGISISDIEALNLSLPKRDMRPLSLEEKIICYADKFFSKRIGWLRHEKTADQARDEFNKFGAEKVEAFDEMHMLFSKRPSQEKGLMPEP